LSFRATIAGRLYEDNGEDGLRGTVFGGRLLAAGGVFIVFSKILQRIDKKVK